MLSTKNQAVKLRLQGKTYTEISESLHVPKSTLSGWLKNLILPPNIAHKLNVDARSVRSAVLIRRNKLQTVTAKKKASETRSDYSRLVGTISQRELLLIGASLYWGEGYKKLKKQEGRELTAHQVSFLNADPVMVKIFIKFLKESLGISEQSIKLTMRLYPGIDEAEAKLFWKEITGLSSENFHKTLYLVSGASKGKRPSNTLPYGTLQISVYSTEKFYQILGLIEGIKKCA